MTPDSALCAVREHRVSMVSHSMYFQMCAKAMRRKLERLDMCMVEKEESGGGGGGGGGAAYTLCATAKTGRTDKKGRGK